jgi:hypothetical protein
MEGFMKFAKMILLAVLFVGVSFAEISDIEQNGVWYYLYDSNGKRYKTMNVSSVGELQGYSSTFFIGKNGDWYYFFDDKGSRFMTKSVKEIGKIKSVSSSGFTSKNNGWIYTWDKKGKRTGTRAAK